MSDKAFAFVEQAFHLPLLTLPTLGNLWGTFSCEIQPGLNDNLSIGKTILVVTSNDFQSVRLLLTICQTSQ